MRSVCGLLAAVLAIVSIAWVYDRHHLATEIAILRSRHEQSELLEDQFEFHLFRKLEPNASLDSCPEIRLFADAILKPGDPEFEACSKHLAEYASNAPDNFDDCEVIIFDVSLDAVPFHGGSYWVLARCDSVVLTYQASAIIGG